MTNWLLSKSSKYKDLSPQELTTLLEDSSPQNNEALSRYAQHIAESRFGRKIFVRGLIEISNYCGNDCLYCGIRKSNKRLRRYRLTSEEILQQCAEGYAMGFRTFVLQGGEDSYWRGERLIKLVNAIRHSYPLVAITLSLGEMDPEDYQDLYDTGANRYLLRHETHNAAHYSQLHPPCMSLSHRLASLEALKRIGFQTGTGIMVGSPQQTIEHMVEDLIFIRDFRPAMIGVGPFLPHSETPFAKEPKGSLELTLRFLALCRILCPDAMIPATTAMATLHPEGRVKAILGGCNVVMPNLSPTAHRKDYSLYDNKASLGAESAEGVALLQKQMQQIGYTIDWGRGDAPL